MALARHTSSSPPAHGTGERQRVLVVDRATELAAALGAALAPHCEVHRLAGAAEAWAAITALAPDLVLIDIDAAADGFALATRLLADARTHDLPVILRGVEATAIEEARGLQLGAIDFVCGPTDPALLALRIANHLRRQRRQERIRSQVAVDEETGLGNRRWLEDCLVREWHRAQRQGTALSLVLVHPHQDEANGVKRIAQGLKAALHRPGNVVTRYGANTFAAILTQTDALGAEHVVCRIRQAIGAAAIGTVTRVPQAGEDPVVLLHLADERLRRVKRTGAEPGAGRAP